MKIRYGLIGYPLGHSFSQRYFTRRFQEAGFSECVYENFPLESIDQLRELVVSHPDLHGFNVTIPYKEQILPLLDELDPVAAAVGAVNCVRIVRGGRRPHLVGYNTDMVGFHAALHTLINLQIDPPNPASNTPNDLVSNVLNTAPCDLTSNYQITPKNTSNSPWNIPPSAPRSTKRSLRALILGTGGASKAVGYVLQHEGIPITTVSRNPQKAMITYNELTENTLNDHLLIVNCTPVGMFPHSQNCPNLPYQAIGHTHYLSDLVYNPTLTCFLQAGIQRGATVQNGLQMLMRQADESFAIWRSVSY